MKKRGRPKGGSQINRELIFSAAFSLLNEYGHQGMSMRSLAQRLGVTPMAIYSHFNDRDALVRGLSDSIYLRVISEFESINGSAMRKLKNLLSFYYDAVVQFPQLTILIFTSTKQFSDEVQKLNNYLSSLLAESNLSPAKRKMWLEILVDFTHGSALATSSSHLNDKNFIGQQKTKYKKQLDELLTQIF